MTKSIMNKEIWKVSNLNGVMIKIILDGKVNSN